MQQSPVYPSGGPLWPTSIQHRLAAENYVADVIPFPPLNMSYATQEHICTVTT